MLVADVARAGRVPEVHQANRPRPGEGGRQLQAVAGKQRGVVIEGAQVTALETVVGPPQTCRAKYSD
ncbi:hypothetical protein D3C77_607300 [compost metagenome]